MEILSARVDFLHTHGHTWRTITWPHFFGYNNFEHKKTELCPDMAKGRTFVMRVMNVRDEKRATLLRSGRRRYSDDRSSLRDMSCLTSDPFSTSPITPTN